MTTTNIEAVPADVLAKVERAVARLADLGTEWAGYRALTFGTRFDADLVRAGAQASATLATFAHHARRNGIDPDAVIAQVRAQVRR